MSLRTSLTALCFIAGLGVSCTSRFKQESVADNTSVDTVLVYIADTSPPFPRFDDRVSRDLPRGSILPSPDAPDCPEPLIDTRTWPRHAVAVHAGRVREFTFHLPPEFKEPHYSSDRMVLWDGPSPALNRRPTSRFKVFINEEHGYPALGIGGGARQTQLEECRFTAASHSVSVVLFTAAWTASGRPEVHYVAAVWDLAPTLQVQLLADGQNSTSQLRFLAALRSLAFSAQ
jgi:hypothetical protein